MDCVSYNSCLKENRSQSVAGIPSVLCIIAIVPLREAVSEKVVSLKCCEESKKLHFWQRAMVSRAGKCIALGHIGMNK